MKGPDPDSRSSSAPTPIIKPEPRLRETWAVVAAWLILAATMVLLARQNTSVPGLYYDESIFAGMAKDALKQPVHGQHIPGSTIVNVLGHPVPLFVQSYLGALKCWVLVPAFAVFGANLATLRMATLGWSLAALLVFMLWVRRWQGLGAALLAGALLALDPTYFFLSLLDWGVAVPSFLCRFACFYFVLRWWREGRTRFAFLAAIAAGIGFFNKVDFAVLAAGAAAGALCSYARPLAARLRASPALLAAACLGLAAGAGPMIGHIPQVLGHALSRGCFLGGAELHEKLNTVLAMYDGSYFYRLMDSGGMFRQMYLAPAPVWSPLGAALVLASAVLVAALARKALSDSLRRWAAFLLLSGVLVTLGVFLMPRAVRIHHAVLVYPFPHLVIVAAWLFVWQRFSSPRAAHRAVRLTMAAGMALLLGSELLAIGKTQRLIRDTGGRGMWSQSLDAFCSQVKNRADFAIVSLDWGFNEQLLFLTDRPELTEPFWSSRYDAPPPNAAAVLYLVHSREYTLFDEGAVALSDMARAAGHVDVQRYCDRQNRVVFYAVQLPAQKGSSPSP